jgi:hypothetical protein
MDDDIKLLQEAFNKLEEKRKVNEIYFNGQIYDAYSKIKDIFFESKEELIIIDNYADKKILDMIKNINTKVSIAIMDAFVKMRHYIKDNLLDQQNINAIVLDDHNHILKLDNDIKLIQEAFDKLEEKRKVNEIYFDGQIYDAYSKIQDIFKSATKKLIIIDAYADNTLLDIIKRLDIEVIIITKKDNLLTKQDIEKYNKQYHNLKVIFNNNFHDRYFLIDDETIYHCGSSINRIGYKTFSINLVSDKEVCNMLIDRVNKIK